MGFYNFFSHSPLWFSAFNSSKYSFVSVLFSDEADPSSLLMVYENGNGSKAESNCVVVDMISKNVKRIACKHSDHAGRQKRNSF